MDTSVTELDRMLERVKAGPDHKETAKNICNYTEFYRAHQNSLQSSAQAFWVRVNEQGLLKYHFQRLLEASEVVTSHCPPQFLKFKTVQNIWGDNFSQRLLECKVPIPRNPSDKFLGFLVSAAKLVSLELFVERVSSIVENRKNRPAGQKVSFIQGIRVLQTADVKDMTTEHKSMLHGSRETNSQARNTAIAVSTRSENADSSTDIVEGFSATDAIHADLSVERPRDAEMDSEEDEEPSIYEESVMAESLSADDYNAEARPLESFGFDQQTEMNLNTNPVLGRQSESISVHDSFTTASNLEHVTSRKRRMGEDDSLQRQPERKMPEPEMKRSKSEHGESEEKKDQEHALRQLKEGQWIDHRTIHMILSRLAVWNKVQLHDPGNLNGPGVDALLHWNPTKVAQKDHDTLIVVLNLVKHWIVFKFCKSMKTFSVYDSGRRFTGTYSEFITEVGQRIGRTISRVNPESDLERLWSQEPYSEDLVQQENTDDCGIFAVYFCLCLSVQTTPKQCDASLLRRAWSILLGDEDPNCHQEPDNQIENLDINYWKREANSAKARILALSNLHEHSLTLLGNAKEHQAQFAEYPSIEATLENIESLKQTWERLCTSYGINEASESQHTNAARRLEAEIRRRERRRTEAEQVFQSTSRYVEVVGETKKSTEEYRERCRSMVYQSHDAMIKEIEDRRDREIQARRKDMDEFEASYQAF